jgi:hypothetical protein
LSEATSGSILLEAACLILEGFTHIVVRKAFGRDALARFLLDALETTKWPGASLFQWTTIWAKWCGTFLLSDRTI